MHGQFNAVVLTACGTARGCCAAVTSLPSNVLLLDKFNVIVPTTVCGDPASTNKACCRVGAGTAKLDMDTANLDTRRTFF